MLGFYEFFCGGVMARAGLEPEWRCLFNNDVDARKGAADAANWTSEQLRIVDVASLRASDLPGEADLSWASFPCRDLSLAGMGTGLNGARSGAFWGFCSAMSALVVDGRPPRAIALKNVAEALTSKSGADFPTICAALQGLADSYALPPRASDAFHLVGDGVAAPVVRFLSENRLLPLVQHRFEGGSALRAKSA
ncbi:MAG TPA: DNA cytosine methyltransferase [Roseiarcus sp.]|jgi:DNA (cytosine-5)-methyltransferase 1